MGREAELAIKELNARYVGLVRSMIARKGGIDAWIFAGTRMSSS